MTARWQNEHFQLSAGAMFGVAFKQQQIARLFLKPATGDEDRRMRIIIINPYHKFIAVQSAQQLITTHMDRLQVCRSNMPADGV